MTTKQEFLTQDQWFTVPRMSDGSVLTPRQALAVYGHTKRSSLPDGLAELADESLETQPVYVVPEDAYAMTSAMEAQWQTHGIFPYDLSVQPEPYDGLTLPAIVKDAMDRIFLPFATQEDLIKLCQHYTGVNIQETENRQQAIRNIRRLPVVRRICRTPDCNELVVMSLKAAVMAIEKYGLLPKSVLKEFGLRTDGASYNSYRVFQPHRLCNRCAGAQYAEAHPVVPAGAQTCVRTLKAPVVGGVPANKSRWTTKLGEILHLTPPTPGSEE